MPEEPDEHEELQAKLANSITITATAGRRKRNPEPSVLQEGKADDTKAPVDYFQWTKESSDSFCPAGQTQKTLPAGGYMVKLDNYGIPHFRVWGITTDNLIDLDDQGGRRVIESIRIFRQRRDKYIKRGKLFRRGILMWGPPGSGKTATLTFVVRELIDVHKGIVLPNDNPVALSNALYHLRKIEPDRDLIVIHEDIEEIIQEHGERELLSLLDGQNRVDNVVHIATTNYPELLGPRIINRPSRFDDVIKIGMPSPGMRRTYLENMIDLTQDEYRRWTKDTSGLSIAHLGELCTAVDILGRGYEETLKRLKNMSITPKSSSLGGPAGFLGGERSDDAGMAAEAAGSAEAQPRRRSLLAAPGA